MKTMISLFALGLAGLLVRSSAFARPAPVPACHLGSITVDTILTIDDDDEEAIDTGAKFRVLSATKSQAGEEATLKVVILADDDDTTLIGTRGTLDLADTSLARNLKCGGVPAHARPNATAIPKPTPDEGALQFDATGRIFDSGAAPNEADLLGAYQATSVVMNPVWGGINEADTNGLKAGALRAFSVTFLSQEFNANFLAVIERAPLSEESSMLNDTSLITTSTVAHIDASTSTVTFLRPAVVSNGTEDMKSGLLYLCRWTSPSEKSRLICKITLAIDPNDSNANPSSFENGEVSGYLILDALPTNSNALAPLPARL